MPNLETRRPFTRSDAIAAGIAPRELRGSRFRRIFRGVYIDSRVPDNPLIRAEAALILHPPDAFASHFSAARVYDVPVPAHSDEHVTVFHKSDRSKRDGIFAHVGEESADVRVVDGVRVSRPGQMLVELASMLALVDLVVVGDALVRLKRITTGVLREDCAEKKGRYTALARRAAAYVRGGVDSPMETRLRMLIVLAGLPEPEVNHKLRNEYGVVVRRLDLSYPSIRLIVEYDGRQHAEDPKQWNVDIKRREEFDDTGWRIIVVTRDGMYKRPADTLARVLKGLKERGWRGLPTRLSDAWRPHFPSR